MRREAWNADQGCGWIGFWGRAASWGVGERQTYVSTNTIQNAFQIPRNISDFFRWIFSKRLRFLYRVSDYYIIISEIIRFFIQKGLD